MQKIIIIVLLFFVIVDLTNIEQNKSQQIIKLNNQFKNDYGKHNFFLQLNQKYVLTPALLFDSQSSFKIQYKLQIENQSTESDPVNTQQSAKSVYSTHPALQKISSYDLTLINSINITDCIIVDIFFQSDQVPFLICLRKTSTIQVFKIEQSQIHFEFSFNVTNNWNQMSVVSETKIVFYNNSNIDFYSYNREDNIVRVSKLNIEKGLLIEKCKPYIDDTTNNRQQIHINNHNYNYNHDNDNNNNLIQSIITTQKLLLICYTNNNQISRSITINSNIKLPSNLNEIKKDYVVVLNLEQSKIQEINHFQLPQKISSLNHIVGFNVIDSLENVIMLCYNLYKINNSGNIEIKQINKQENVYDTTFASSYCSIFKIYLIESQMVLINRMMLQPSPYPLLQTSLQINVMLAVSTQTSITFYHLDVLKQMFQFIQKIPIPENDSFNCYQYSKLKNSFDSVSLTCAKNGQESQTVSFIMIYDQDLQKYITVGDVIKGKRFYHSSNVIFELDEHELILKHANQQYIVFNYVPVVTCVKIYEVILSKPQQRGNFTSVMIIPALYGQVYVNKPLPYIIQTSYDMETYLDLKGAFAGSNISFVKAEVLDNNDNNKKQFIQDHNYISQNRIYSYDYSLLLSVYIQQQCIRVIKIDDSSFYRILRIEKSRVDEAEKNVEWNSRGDENRKNKGDDEKGDDNEDDDEIEYYYYTETCSKLQDAYVCQLTQVHTITSGISTPSSPTSKISSTKHSEVIDIQFLLQSNMFVYLFQWKNPNTQKKQMLSPSHFGLMFVSMLENNNDNATLHCYQLKLLIQEIYQKMLKIEKEEVQLQKLNITKVQLSKDWLFFQINLSVKVVKVYCLINNVKTYFFSSQQHNQTLQIQNSCIILNHNAEQLYQSREFIQDGRLIISQILTQSKTGSKSRKLTVFNVINSDQIIKQGTYIFSDTRNQLIQPNSEIEFIGLYKQYMIIVNETTISKYYIGIKPQLVYEFVYNPEFSQLNGDRKNEQNTFEVKYVLFLERYLIVQFESFYQLYDIGGQLISIQIAANNFIAYQKTLTYQQQIVNKTHKPINNGRVTNVIINDAFLIEGDNIIIYEKNHLVVAKYITNPRLTLGSFQKNHGAVQKDLQLKLTPVLDYFIQTNQVFQDVMLKIIYSQYVVQKIAKKIKTLTVPSQTQNYQLEIWTNVFRGPVLQYYLSDTFDGQIVLKQHIQQVQKNGSNQNQSDDFLVVEHYSPFETKYIMKRNSSHLLIEERPNIDDQGLQTNNQNTNQKHFIPLTKQLKYELFLKFTRFNSTIKNNTEIICILTDNSVVFIKATRGNNSSKTNFVLMDSISHNVTIEIEGNKYVTSVKMEVLIDKGKVEKMENKEQQRFIIALLGSQQSKQSQNNSKLQQSIHPTSIQLLQVSLQIDSSQQINITVTKVQQLIIEQEILHIRSINGMNSINQSQQLIVLTYLQSLRFYKINGEKDQSLLELRQSVNLNDIIPPKYWLNNEEKYITFQIIAQFVSQLKPENYNLTDNNITLLLFSQTDKAFHVEFEMFKSANNEDQYNFQLKNIYAGYPNFKFLSLVKIGLKKDDERKKDEKHKNSQFAQKIQLFGDTSSFDSQKQQQSKSKGIPKWYIYFIVLNEYTTTSQVYLTYYSFNYNFTTTNKEVGYFKCGEKISLEEVDNDNDNDDDNDDKNQNIIERKRQQLTESDSMERYSTIKNFKDNNNNKIYYSFAFLQNDLILVQLTNFTTTSSGTNTPQLFNYQSISLIKQTALQVNTSIYMILNYEKPPILSYVLLNARNFNVRAGIYTKFIFLQDRQKWTVFFSVFPIILLLLVGCGFLLKKHQPKDSLINNKSQKPSIQEIIYSSSSSSRSTKTKQQRVICIDSSDDDQSINYRQSLQVDEEKNPIQRIGYIPPDSFRINKGSSIHDSPLKPYYPQDIDESDIECTPTIKFITSPGSDQYFNNDDNDHEEDKQILQYLMSKKGSFVSSNGSSFEK